MRTDPKGGQEEMELKMLVTVVEMMPQDRESEKGLQHEPDAFQETQQV